MDEKIDAALGRILKGCKGTLSPAQIYLIQDELRGAIFTTAEECAKEAEAAFQPMRDFKGTNLYFERCARVIRAKFPAPANTPVIPPLQPGN